MTDRPQQPAANDDDDLAYLDAGLPPEDRTQPIGPEPEEVSGTTASTTTTPIVTPPPSRHVTEPSISKTPPPADPSSASTPPSAEPVVTAERDSSWTWPLVNLIGLLVTVAVNYAATYFEFNGNSTGDIVNRDPVPFQPAGWVFSIWGVIYLLLGIFVVYGLLGGRHNPRLQRISPLFLVSNIANVVWIFFWHWEQIPASLGAMTVLLVSLVGIYIGVRFHGNPLRRASREAVDRPGWFERLALRLPFSVYLGWITVATLANVMVWLNDTGRDSGLFTLTWWAVIFMIVAVLVGAVFMATSHDGIIALVIAVALIGIADRNWGDHTTVSVVAAIFAVLAFVIAGASALMAFDRTTNGSLPGTGRWRRSQPMT